MQKNIDNITSKKYIRSYVGNFLFFLIQFNISTYINSKTLKNNKWLRRQHKHKRGIHEIICSEI